jgi:non-heme chloroperoxidase
MNIVVDNDVTLYAQELGEGLPVILLPGLFMSHQVWDDQVRQLSAKYRTLALDLRGHGRSSKPVAGYSVEQHVSDVVSVIDQLDLSDAAVIGWSFGGAVAFGVAAARPERIAKLALVGSNAVRFHPNEQYPFGVDAAVTGAMIAGESTARVLFRHAALSASFHTPPAQPYLDWVLNDSLQTPSWAGVQCLQALSDLDQTDLIAAVQMPVLQLHGAQDPSWPIDGAKWLSQKLKDATLVEFDSCGHFPPIEHPVEFNSALMSFVNA